MVLFVKGLVIVIRYDSTKKNRRGKATLMRICMFSSNFGNEMWFVSLFLLGEDKQCNIINLSWEKSVLNRADVNHKNLSFKVMPNNCDLGKFQRDGN